MNQDIAEALADLESILSEGGQELADSRARVAKMKSAFEQGSISLDELRDLLETEAGTIEQIRLSETIRERAVVQGAADFLVKLLQKIPK